MSTSRCLDLISGCRGAGEFNDTSQSNDGLSQPVSPLAVWDKQNLMNLYCCNESCCTEWDQIKVVKQPFCDKNTH